MNEGIVSTRWLTPERPRSAAAWLLIRAAGAGSHEGKPHYFTAARVSSNQSYMRP